MKLHVLMWCPTEITIVTHSIAVKKLIFNYQLEKKLFKKTRANNEYKHLYVISYILAKLSKLKRWRNKKKLVPPTMPKIFRSL